MKVLFINPPNTPFTSHKLLIEPIDILTVATIVKDQGHEVRVLDMDLEQMSPKDSELIIKNFTPHLVVFLFDYHIPLHTTKALGKIIKIAIIAKKHHAIVVAGGKMATFHKESLLHQRSPIDYTISHDVETSLVSILDHLQNGKNISSIKNLSFFKNGKIYENDLDKKPDISNFPIPDRSLVNLDKYVKVRTILSSRGCPEKCIFCSTPGFWGNWRFRTPQSVVKEIKILVDQFKAQKILFLDDNATVNNARMQAISKLIIKNNIKVKLGCLGSIFSFSLPMMTKMYQAGFCWIHYGIESGSNRLLNQVNKKTNSDQIKTVLQKTKEIGFRIRTSWIVDLPNTTKQDLKNTIQLIKDTQPDEIRIHFLTLRLGSQVYKKHIKNNKINTQYIHNNRQNINLSKLSPAHITQEISSLLSYLQKQKYVVIKKQSDLDKLKINSNTKIVSLCPLTYGLAW